MTLRNDFIQAAAKMESALASVINQSFDATSTSRNLERLLKLVIKKEIVLDLLLDEFPTPTCTVKTNIFFNTTPIAIPASGVSGPATPYPSSILVSGLTGAVQKVTVTFHDLSISYPYELSAILIGPNGQDTILMSYVGGNETTDATTTLDDDAANELSTLGPIPTGTFRPTNHGVFGFFPPPATQPSGNTELSVYINSDPNGIWNLFIIDQFGLEGIGRLNGGWSLNITTCEEAKGKEMT